MNINAVPKKYNNKIWHTSVSKKKPSNKNKNRKKQSLKNRNNNPKKNSFWPRGRHVGSLFLRNPRKAI